MPRRKRLKPHRGSNDLAGALQRVKQLGGKVLQDGDDVSITLIEIDNVIDEVAKWAVKANESNGGTPGLWAAVGQDGILQLQALYALSLRRSCATLTPGVSEPMRSAFCSLRAKLSSELFIITDDDENHISPKCIATVVFAALRAQALRCIAGLLADASALLQAKSSRRPRRILQNAVHILTETRELLQLFGEVLSKYSATLGVGAMDWAMFRQCIAAELQESHLLEHWSRLLLQLSMHEGWEDEARQQLYLMSEQLRGLDTIFCGQRDHLCNMLTSSPCLSYILSSHVVGLCAVLDGGTTYGMTPDSDAAEEDLAAPRRAAAPVFSSSGARLRRNTPEGASTKLAKWTLRLWSDVLSQENERSKDRWRVVGAMPPLHTDAMLELCLRLAAAASTALAADTTPLSRATGGDSTIGGSGAICGSEVGSGMRVAAGEAAGLAAESLRCGRQAISGAASQFRALPRGAASRLERFYEAVGALLQAAAQRMRTGRADELSTRFWAELWEAMRLVCTAEWKVQDGPSQGAVAALRCGWVPKLDSLLRAMGANDNRSWTASLPVQPLFKKFSVWPQILAFGDPSDTASLIATVVRLLRGWMSCGLLAGDGGGSGVGRVPPGGMDDFFGMFGVTLQYCGMMFLSAVKVLIRSAVYDRKLRPRWEQQQHRGQGQQPSTVGDQQPDQRGQEEQQQLVVGEATAPGIDQQAVSPCTGGANGANGDGSLQRLALLVSYMVVHLVPELRRVMIDLCLHYVKLRASEIEMLLYWVALLAAAHGQSVAAPAAAGPSGEADKAPSPSSVWRDLLMADASLAKILSSALTLLSMTTSNDLHYLAVTVRRTLHVLVRDAPRELMEALHHPECRTLCMALKGAPDSLEAAATDASDELWAKARCMAFAGQALLMRIDSCTDAKLAMAVFEDVLGSSSQSASVQLPEVGPPPEAVERFRAAASLLTPSDRLLALLPLDLAAGPGRPRHAQ